MTPRVQAYAVAILSLALLVFLHEYFPSRTGRVDAQRRYEAARASLESVTTEQRKLEEHLQNMKTRTDIVELKARAEFRLIRPGERMGVIEIAHR